MDEAAYWPGTDTTSATPKEQPVPKSNELLSAVASAVRADPEFAIKVLTAVERGHAQHRAALRASYTVKDAGFLAAVALATSKRRTPEVRACVVPTIARAIHPASASNCEREILAEASAIETRQGGNEVPSSDESAVGVAETPKAHVNHTPE